MAVNEAEQAAMLRALALGETARGVTSPNPPVGAVILAADGSFAGEGATAPVGGPHAEVVALAAAGDRARGGTAVVTLEPCAHTGRTGPCTTPSPCLRWWSTKGLSGSTAPLTTNRIDPLFSTNALWSRLPFSGPEYPTSSMPHADW